MKWHGAWLYDEQRTHRDGSSFMRHQPCQHCKYATSVDIEKCAIKSFSLMQNQWWVQWVCLRAGITAMNNNNSILQGQSRHLTTTTPNQKGNHGKQSSTSTNKIRLTELGSNRKLADGDCQQTIIGGATTILLSSTEQAARQWGKPRRQLNKQHNIWKVSKGRQTEGLEREEGQEDRRAGEGRLGRQKGWRGKVRKTEGLEKEEGWRRQKGWRGKKGEEDRRAREGRRVRETEGCRGKKG